MYPSLELKKNFDQLTSCLWYFNFTQRKMEWANSSAVHLWNAENLEALLERNFKDISESALQRLLDIRESFEREGSSPATLWTFYPNGNPVSVHLECRNIFNWENDVIYFFEVQYSRNRNFNSDELRGLEAIRHTTVNICIVDMTDQILLQNPQDKQTFGSLKFQERFLKEEHFSNFKKSILETSTFSQRVTQQTINGAVIFGMEARLSSDPTSGKDCVIVSQIDMSEQILAEKNAKIQERLVEVAKLEGLQAELRKDLELTRAVQDLFLPNDERVNFAGWSLYGKVQPASLCSGDWWWHFKKKDVLYVFIADVTGHGAHSAMITSILASSIKYRFENLEDGNVENALRQINRDIYSLCKEEYFSTLHCVALNPKAGEAEVYLQGAPPVFHFLNDHTMKGYSEPSTLIGTNPKGFTSARISLKLELNERLVIVSDGFSEETTSSGAMMGERRSTDIFKECRVSCPRETVEQSLEKLSEATQRQHYRDDITIVVIDRLTA